MYGLHDNKKQPLKSAMKSDSTAASRSSIRRRAAVRHRDGPSSQNRRSISGERSVRLSLVNQIVNGDDDAHVSDASNAAVSTRGADLQMTIRPDNPSRPRGQGESERRSETHLDRSRGESMSQAGWAQEVILRLDEPASQSHRDLVRTHNESRRTDRMPRSRSERFAPAYRFEDEAQSHGTATPSDGFPPLERQSLRFPDEISIVSRSFDTIDGLGDRRRSPSPEDNAWETLLTTITPDERLPSVSSSFTSSSASESFSANTSTSTSLTSSSTTGPVIVTATYVCDEPSPGRSDGGSFEDAEFDPEPPNSDPPLYSSRAYVEVRERMREREHQAAQAGRRRRLVELILDHTDRGEPIPDELWSAAHLPRSILLGDTSRSRAGRERL